MDLALVIPAAGRATRLLPETQNAPKGMLLLANRPVLECVIDVGMQLPIARIVLITGDHGQIIREHFGTSYCGVPIIYVTQKEQKGLAHAVSLAEAHVRDLMLVINGDELYLNSRHSEMLRLLKKKPLDGVVGFLRTSNPDLIRGTYGMDLAEDGKVTRVVEKPSAPWNDVLGVGTWLLNCDFFHYFGRTPIHRVRLERDFVAVIQQMVDDGKAIYGMDLHGDYFNINTAEDKQKAELALTRQRFLSAESANGSPSPHRISLNVARASDGRRSKF